MDENKVRMYTLLVLGVAAAFSLFIIGSNNPLSVDETGAAGAGYTYAYCVCTYDDGISYGSANCPTWKDRGSIPATYKGTEISKLVKFECVKK
ncbi:MAG: hypothetical protein ACP5NW_03215 [Candidatus Woesearchaeota archaeon]